METKETEFIYTERTSKHQFFDKRLIRHIVDLVEQGVPRRDLIAQYGMSKGTLITWVANGGVCAEKPKVYSLAQKRSVIRAIDGGMSIREAQVAFGIRSRRLVSNWIKLFKEENVELYSFNFIEMGKKTTEQHVSPEIQALKKALEESNLKVRALDTLIDVAEQQLKIDIRKKSGAKQSSK